jgi:hypothetical protein
VNNGSFSDSIGDMHQPEYPDTQISGYTDTQISGDTIESDLKMSGENDDKISNFDFIFNSKKFELETEENTKILKKRQKLLMKCTLINDNNNFISMMTTLLDETAKNSSKYSSSLSLPLSTSSLPLKECSSIPLKECSSAPLSGTSLPLSLPLSCTPVPVFLPLNPSNPLHTPQSMSQNEDSRKPHPRPKVHKNLNKFLDMPRSPFESPPIVSPPSLHLNDNSSDQNMSFTLLTILSNAFHALDTDGDDFLTASDFCTQGINYILLFIYYVRVMWIYIKASIFKHINV